MKRSLSNAMVTCWFWVFYNIGALRLPRPPRRHSCPPGSGGLASASEPGGHNFLNSTVTTPAPFFMLRPVGLALRGGSRAIQTTHFVCKALIKGSRFPPIYFNAGNTRCGSLWRRSAEHRGSRFLDRKKRFDPIPERPSLLLPEFVESS